MRSPALALVLVLVVAALAVAPTTAHAEFCGAMGLDARVVSPPDLVLPGDGGILVAAVPGFGGAERDAAVQPAWRFAAAGRTTAPRRTQLAPGLVVYAARQDGAVTLVDEADGARATAFVTRRARPRLAAPRVAWTAAIHPEVLIQLASDPPADAAAIVVVGKDGQARSWGAVDHGSRLQHVSTQRGCQMQPPGTQSSTAGEEVSFFFVDVFGRPSATSAAHTIVAKAP